MRKSSRFFPLLIAAVSHLGLRTAPSPGVSLAVLILRGDLSALGRAPPFFRPNVRRRP